MNARSDRKAWIWTIPFAICCIIVLGVLLRSEPSWSQDTRDDPEDELRDRYSIGADERLQITVHIWGAVRKPGQLKVRDTTNILELISIAGGPAQYADLKKVELTRVHQQSYRFLTIDLEEYIRAESYYDAPPPVLEPGDIVRVPKNSWYIWRTAIQVASEVIIITRLYIWLTRL